MVELTDKDIQVLRQLAVQCMEITALPAQEERRALWLALNRCAMQRPLAVIDQIPWHEMDVDGSLQNQVEDPYWRGVETELRRLLYRWVHMPADMVVNPYVMLPRPIVNTGYGMAVQEETALTDRRNDVVSHHYENQFTGFEDLEKIKTPRVTLEVAREAEIRQQAEHLFAGIAPFRLCGMPVHLGLWDAVTSWMGVEDVYIELMDRPELLHAIMARLTEATLAMLDQMEEQGLFDVVSNQCHCSYTFCEDLPAPGADPEHPSGKDAWAFGMAQLFTSVSPSVTAEFEVPYMQKLFPRFGRIYYGCCDRLDDRLEVVVQMPGIRKISCSPWSDRENFARNLPGGYVMSNKPNPTLVAGAAVDWDEVRRDIRRTVDAARAYNVPLELILKDISTVQYQPQRLWEWSRIAAEELAC